MKMGRGVCAHLRSFFLFLYQSGSVPVATKGATLLEIVYTRHRDALRLYIVPLFPPLSPYRYLFIFGKHAFGNSCARNPHRCVVWATD